MKIALARSNSNFDKYKNWLEHFNVEYEVLDYESKEDEFAKIDRCSGLILTGGVDIDPEFYCDRENLNNDNTDTTGTFMPQRDRFELKIIEIAVKNKLPILAICRGLQIMNVYFKGNIISDLMEVRGVNHDRISETEGRIHDVEISKNSLLFDILNLDTTEVNSFHHQAIDRLGEGLIINAKSSDGIVEGIEYFDKKDKPFFLGIQWHPERFIDQKDPAAEKILNYFINECKKFS